MALKQRCLRRVVIVSIGLLVVLRFCASAWAQTRTGTYLFNPDQSTVVETGGIGGITATYTIEGQFRLTVDLDTNTASFNHVDANLSESVVGGYGQSLDDLFDMTDLVGTVISDTKIEFDTPDPMPGGKIVHLDLTFTGNSIHLTGGFREILLYGFCYTLDAVAVGGCTYYVDAANGDDDNGGLTPETAFASVQVGIDAAADGDTVIVADGTYVGRGNTNLDFAGRAITLRSENGPDLTIIDCQNDGRGFYFHSGEDANSILSGFTITRGHTGGSGGAIYCEQASPTITNCVLVVNTASNGGAIGCFFGNPTIMNCLITGNLSDGMCGVIPNGCGGGVSCVDSGPTITNCTITGNYGNCAGGGIIAALFTSDNGPTISNCILWGDTPEEIYAYFVTPSITYCDVQGGWSGDGNNNIDADPCFASPGFWAHANDPNVIVEPNDPNAAWIDGDYHLRSPAGRWDPGRNTWVIDTDTSSCIDAGNPNSDWAAELWPHGKRINMGAYGGTPEASMSLSDAGNIADFNNDGAVGYTDLMLFTDEWPSQEILLRQDLDRNGVVNFPDFAIFANNWLREE